MSNINKLGTQIRLPDGRVGTVIYNSLSGIGIKFGLHNPSPKEFMETDGNMSRRAKPEGFHWQPDAMLREPGTIPDIECVGAEFEILKVGLE